MADHVAVLRELRADHENAGIPEHAAALDHAIAACEREAALVARLDGALRELHLVYQSIGNDAMAEATMRRIDALARVVAGNGGGDGR